VTAFYPMLTDYSVRTPSQNTITRFNLIALAAIKQCDNPWMPKINEPLPLEETVNKIFSEGWIPVLCSERKPDKRITYLPKIIKPCFLIGPEGGFSEDEFTYFSEQNILSISICHLITRAETAAIAVAAQYQAYF
ncbi:MAG: RNA methyltransferase, partial [Candidatus Cloacimonetes bacterium]|nr:RNA methyltransferase [Candidatus Cloacimonadota bacterium]